MPAWNKIYIPKEKLKKLYLQKRYSIAKIAKLIGCSNRPIHRLLCEYKIPIRTLSGVCIKFPISKRQLKDWYFKDKLSMFEIANHLGCTHSAIVYKFKKFGLISRGHLGLTKPINLTKKGFEYLYSKRGLSLEKIAKVSHCSRGGIERRFNKYALISRGLKNRACKYKKSGFSGNLIEKAYLIGFRLGDLNVKKIVNVIQIRCSTTVPAQVRLLRKLFLSYTTPYIWRARRGTTEIVSLVNKSFDFLLSKHENIPTWIKANKKYFFSFFAGYSDAEGCFYFKRPGLKGKTKIASFEIQTQQKYIIQELWTNMQKYKIYAPIPKISVKGGCIRSNGLRNNRDMWRFEVCKKESLWNLINLLEPYTKHANKIRRIKEVRSNLLLRNSIPYGHIINLSVAV